MGNWINFGNHRCQKYASHQKKGSSKSCLELNFARKSLRAHMSISPMSGARGLQRSVCLKFYKVQKWEIRFTLGLSDASLHQNIFQKFVRSSKFF